MPEKPPTESNPTAPPRSPGGGRRRGRRGGRGRRRPAPAATVSGPLAQAESPAKQIEPPIRLHEMPVRPVLSKQKIHSPVPVTRAEKPDGSAIRQAVAEVTRVVESLEQALEQMEEVLELVEVAERQKITDEHEIESLRRALHKLQPPHREQRAHGS